ncbi:MAG: EF-hand domain-containing protein [Tagaea sp.]
MTSSISGFGGIPSSGQLAQIRERMFQKADANGDGSIDKTEFAKGPQPPGMGGKGMPSSDEMFAKIDGDGNGALSKDEMKAFGEKMSTQMKSMLLGAQESAGDENENPLDALFKALDQDEDGAVSKGEFEQFGKRARENGARQGNDAYADALNLLPTSLASLLGNGEDSSRRTQDELIGLLMKA